MVRHNRRTAGMICLGVIALILLDMLAAAMKIEPPPVPALMWYDSDTWQTLQQIWSLPFGAIILAARDLDALSPSKLNC
jgi:hypothetical protein